MTSIMQCVREFADAERAIMMLSAVARGRSDKGSTYERGSMSLASYRESSELEYGADSAWLLTDDDDETHLTCLKNRHGQTPDLLIQFNKSTQTFDLASDLLSVNRSDSKAVKQRRFTRKELRERAREAWKVDTTPDEDGEDF
jgi:hypothetical protein